MRLARFQKFCIQPKQWLTTRKHNISISQRIFIVPERGDFFRQFFGGGEFAAILAICADEVCIAKVQVAVARSASSPDQRLHPAKRQHSRTPGLCAFALQGVVHLFHTIGHAILFSGYPLFIPLGRSSHAGQSLQLPFMAGVAITAITAMCGIANEVNERITPQCF